MKYTFAFLFSVLSFVAIGQTDSKPVKWTFEVTKTETDEYLFVATAKMYGDWAIYSQFTEEGGPVPISFSYEDESILIKDTKELSTPIKKMSELFEIEVVKFKKKAKFQQRFKAQEGQESFKGSLKFMSCDESRCLMPTVVPFDVSF